MLDAIRIILLWVSKYLKDKSKIQKLKEIMKMNEAEMKIFERQIIGARISGELERDYEKGYKEGYESTRNKAISHLLKKYSPEEISKMINASTDEIEKIKHDNS